MNFECILAMVFKTGVIGYVRTLCTFYLGRASKRFTLQEEEGEEEEEEEEEE